MGIVEELRTNRESGAKRLEIEYKAGLMTLAKRFHADESDAEELVNRTFAAVVNGIDGYLARSAFFTWMCQILINLHANDTRRKANGAVVYPGTIPDVADESSQEAVYSAMDGSMLRDAIETLPEEMRKTLLLHYFMDMPVKDIARFLAIPSGTVLWRLHYARQMLAAKLGAKAKRPGGKAILLALAFAALTAIGAAGVAAVRYAAGHGAEEAEVVFNAEGAELAEGSLTGFTGLEETGDMPNATNSGQGEGGSGQAGATTAISETSNEECTMNIKSIKSAAVKTLAAGAMLAATASGETVCYFDGSTYIDTGEKFPLGDSVSLSAWVRVDPKFAELKPGGAGIVGQGYWGNTTGLGFLVSGEASAATSDDRISWQVRNGGTCQAADYYDTTLFTAGEWHHYLLVRDKENGKARFYVDGALVNEESFDGALDISPAHQFAIGKNMAGVGGIFCGYIADVALWDVALSAADAAALPSVGVKFVSSKPFAYFALDEGSGNMVHEEIANTTYSSTGGGLQWVADPTFSRIRGDDRLFTSSSLNMDVGSPSSAYGVTNGLVAGDSFVVTCGATPVFNAAGTVRYSCLGWKLYDKHGSVVSNGTETSFTYTHPDPAACRRLEWQWDKHIVRRKTSASLYVKDGLVAFWDGIENAGPGAHDDSPSAWMDHVCGLEIVIPEWVTAESNAFYSTSSTATRTYPTLSSIPGLGDNVTIEVVAERVMWRYTDSYFSLQNFIMSPYGSFGYRHEHASGVYYCLPLESNGILTLYSPRFDTGGFDVAECHTYAVRVTLPYDASNVMVVDGAAAGGFTRDGFTQASPSKWTFFCAQRADIRIHAIRVYNRRLTDDEIDANHALDVKRFQEGNNIKVPQLGFAIIIR